MKKIFYSILAAAAIVASCVKEPINEPVSPSGDGSSVFTGTIIQPGGIDEATKVSIIDQTSEVDKVYIKWTINDQIYIIKKGSDQWNSTSESTKPKVFEAASSEATTEFTGYPPTDWIAPGATYAARYYGKNNVWREYVLAGESVKGITIDCKSNDGAAFLENMPLSCGASEYDSGNFRYNFTFSNAYAILQINVPSKLSFDDLYVCVNAQNVEFESGQLKAGSKYTLCLDGADAVKSTYFVPVTARSYDKLTIVAAKDNAEVARMETYAGNVKNGSDSPYVLPELNSNNIYPFDFCNTKTIDAAGTYSLESNDGIDYKVNIAADIATDVTINADVEGKEPANIYINNRGHQISGKLTINASESHVEGENGFATEVEAHTSNSTFVVKPTLTITGLTVKKGSVVVEGTADKKANVATITIPSEVTEQIKIDVSGVSANAEGDRVKIVNKSEVETVVVVPDQTGTDQKSYVVDKTEDGSQDVTEVSKNAVAIIGITEYETIAEAIAAATSNDVINVIAESVELPELKKEGITLKGNGSTKVTLFGGLTGKDIILDGFEFAVSTNPQGENFKIKNSKFTGTNGLRWAYANGNVLIENCVFDTNTYGIHFDGNSAKVTVKDCEIVGFNTFNPSLTFENCKFVDSKKGNKYYVVQGYGNVAFKDCSFSEKWCDTNPDVQTIGLATNQGLAEINNCTFAQGTVYDACKNSGLGVIAIDAEGNATDGFTAGTFVAKQAEDIKAAAGYEVKTVEGKDNVFTIAAGAGVAKIGNTTYETLAEAIAAAQAGDVVSIVKADTYKIPSIKADITVAGAVDNVVFDCVGSGNIVEIPNGPTFKNVTMEFGQSGYHGFQHAGHITMEECTLNGLFHSYGVMTFNKCTFNQTKEEYNMWVYAGNVTYSDCTFNSVGKFLNVYNEGNDHGTPWEVVAKNCVFNTTKKNKAALNIKETCGSTFLKYNVTIENCSCNDLQNSLENKDDGSLYRISPIWQVDDIKAGDAAINVTVDGVKQFPATNFKVASVDALKSAVNMFNSGKEAVEYTIELADGTYEVSDIVLWQNLTGKSLVIKAAESADVTVKPVASGNKSPYIFLVAGGSSYDATRAISFNGIKFDYTQAADITSAPVYCCQQMDSYVSQIEGIDPTNDTRYAHNITFNNCSLSVFSAETENISFIAGPSAGSPKDVAFNNCTMTNGGYIHSGYIKGITCDNCTVTGVKALINSQGEDGGYTITIKNSAINSYHDYVVRTSGGNVVVENNTFTAVYSGTGDGIGVVVLRKKATGATFAGNTFTKSSSSMWDCYCANACTVNEKARTAGTGINFPEPKEN